MDIQLRPIEESDREFLWGLHRAALKPYIEQTWGWDEDFQRRYFMEHYPPFASQIIVRGGQDLGVLSVDESGREVILRNIEVLPEFQGMGIGSQVIGEILARAAECGKAVSLRVLKVNPARNLYLRLGFSVIGETETHFWMRKEGHAAEFLPARWETRRCFLTEITPDAEEMLTTMFSENPELLEQYRPGVLPQEAAADIAVQRPLPPGGVIWRDRAYLVRELESRETCGFVVLYFGYPTPETVYIRSMYLRPYCRGTGMGRQLLSALEEQALALGFREARVMVGLKDWSALRFWTGCGFGRIARLKDAPEGENGLANVELMKTLAVPAEK